MAGSNTCSLGIAFLHNLIFACVHIVYDTLFAPLQCDRDHCEPGQQMYEEREYSSEKG
jgi:hypothetical protein